MAKKWRMLRRREPAPADRPDRDEAASGPVQARLDAAGAALDALTDGIVVFDPDGRLAYLNPAGRDLIGRRFETIGELAPTVLRDAAAEVAETGTAAELEFETAGRIVQASVAPNGGQDESSSGIVLVLRDVTAARRSDRIRRDFVANASHELKTPVSAIAALAEALRDAARDPAASERFVALLQEESIRLSRLDADLLDMSRLEGERPELTPVRLDRVVAEESERLRPSAEGVGLRMVVESLAATELLGSEGDLGLLVHNLVDNAIHYTPAGGEVRVSLRKDAERAVLEVADTGIGIASRDRGRIFERFYRVDPARSRQTGGTGLGLSIVRHVAELHGGEVAVQSVLGAGSTFIVELPIAETTGGGSVVDQPAPVVKPLPQAGR